MADDRPIILFDTETKCELDLGMVGRHRYLGHYSADLLMFGHAVGAGRTELWLPGKPVPFHFKRPEHFRFAAFNVQFDWRVMNRFAKRYGFGKIKLDQCIDVMAVAARYTLPQSLDKLGAMLKVQMQKMKAGNALKKVCCQPPFKPTKEQWKQFCLYCIRDVDSMREIMNKLPSNCLSDAEQAIWLDTARINNHGVPVDLRSVKQINKVVEYYTKKQAQRLPYLTGGAVKTVGQIQKIRDWCATKGVELPNLQVQTVAAAMEKLELDVQEASLYPDDDVGADYLSVMEVLKIRQLIGGAAVKKYKRLLDMTHNGFIHDNLRYHGAGTGRTTGGGFQMLNLPRAKVKPKKGETYDEAVIEVLKKFYDVSILDHPDPLLEAKKLVRPMLKAPKDKVIMAADWSSIEYILLMYYAGEWDKVKLFANGADPYKVFATELFHVSYDQVTDSMRQDSKPPVLGSGYMLGWRGLIAYAEGYGVAMDEEQAQFATNTYRETHKKVKSAWYALKRAAHKAVRRPGMVVNVLSQNGEHNLNTIFQVQKDRTGRPWLILTLPSGRNLFYCEPWLADGEYGDVIKHRGIDPYTKQWSDVYLKPQRMIENVIQGLGRDILNFALPKIRAAGFTPIAHVYDEIINLEPDVACDERLKELCQIMCESPPWMPQLPLRAEGWVGKCYRKD